MMFNIREIKRWDQYNKAVEFSDNLGAPVDITGATVYFTVRTESTIWDADDTTAIIQKDVTLHSDAINWKTTIPLTSTDTDQTPWDYLWEIQIKFSSGDIRTTNTDTIRIVQDLTKRTL